MKIQNFISNIGYFFRIKKLSFLANIFYLLSISINKKNFNTLFKYADFLVEWKKFDEAKKIYLQIIDEASQPEQSNALYYLAILSFNNRSNENIGDLFKKSYEKKIEGNLKFLESFYPPFIIRLKINNENEININELIEKFYNYEKENSKTSYSTHGHINTYQSNHDLNKNTNFLKVTSFIEQNINKTIKTKIFKKIDNIPDIKIKKMWFVISRTGSKMNKHMHHGFLSGVFYLKVSSDDKPGFIEFNNPQKNIKVYEIDKDIDQINKEEIISIKPSKNELIIFNSYLEHWVVDNESKESRISLPWDAEY